MGWIQLKDSNWRVAYEGGWCLSYVQDTFGTDHSYPSAIDAWNDNFGQGNHANELPPVGKTVPVYFSLGNVAAGHVAVSLDDGYVASSTLPGSHPSGYLHPNLQDLINIYGKYNGGCSYLGWSEYVGHVKVLGWEDYRNERYSEPIAFDKTTETDATLPVGQTVIKQAGVNGEHWWVDHIRTIDNNEQDRTRIDEGTNPMQSEITSVGTLLAVVDPVVTPVEPPVTPVEPPTVPVVDVPVVPIVDPPVQVEPPAKYSKLIKFIKLLIEFLKGFVK